MAKHDARGGDAKEVKSIWLDGEIVPFAEGKIHVHSGGAFYGANVFEGIRSYWNEQKQQMYCFRLRDHYRRFRRSLAMMRFDFPYSDEEVEGSLLDVIRSNELQEDVHLLQVAYLKVFGLDNPGPIGMYIVPRKVGRVFGEGLHCCVSSWVRTADNAIPVRIKVGSNYQNGRLAALEARANGYDMAILMTRTGKVAEGPGANIFVVRDGTVLTPPVTADILEGITRLTVMQILEEDFGLRAVERDIDRTELYACEEAFFCGTAYEITPILSIDKLPVGGGVKAGPLSRDLQRRYFDLVRGNVSDHDEWRTPVY